MPCCSQTSTTGVCGCAVNVARGLATPVSILGPDRRARGKREVTKIEQIDRRCFGVFLGTGCFHHDVGRVAIICKLCRAHCREPLFLITVQLFDCVVQHTDEGQICH